MKSKMVKAVNQNLFSLVVSIPGNDVEMAIAAQEGGADGIKLHLNVHHYASGVNYGPWHDEKKRVREILDKINIPVGILPGAEKVASPDEITEAAEMGIDFIDSFAHDLPAYLWKIADLGMMLAVNQTYNHRKVAALEEIGVDIFEATLLPHEEYGKRLTLRDASLYHELAHSTSRPVLIPTQKKIFPEEVNILKKAGAKGIIIGAVVTGNTADGVFRTTRAFREAISLMK